MPESFQYGREVFEVVTNEMNPIGERGEVGPTLLKGLRIAVDPDQERRRRRLEKRPSVTAAPEGRVDEDPSAAKGRDQEFPDCGNENGLVIHSKAPSWASTRYLPSARVAIDTMPSTPPTDEPVSASSTTL